MTHFRADRWNWTSLAASAELPRDPYATREDMPPSSDSRLTVRLSGIGERWGMPLFERRLNFYLTQNLWDSFYEPVLDGLSLELALDRVLQLREHATDARWRPAMELVIEMFPSLYSAPDGRVPLPAEGERFLGHHAVVVDGIEDSAEGAVLRFTHNLGDQRPGWGKDGRGYLSLAYLERHYHEAWVVRPYAGPRKDRSADEFFDVELDSASLMDAESWNHGNSPDRFLLEQSETEQFRVARYESLASARPTFVFEAWQRSGRGTWDKIGWMNVILQPGVEELSQPPIARVSEFFVWPHFREKGVGTRLVTAACKLLRWLGVEAFVWWALEADSLAISHSRAAPRLPAWLKGLKWCAPEPLGDENRLAIAPTIVQVATGSLSALPESG